MKKWIKAMGILLGSILVLGIVCISAMAILSMKGYGVSVGRCLKHSNGSYLLVVGETPIYMSGKEKHFQGLKTGDKLLVLHDGIEETYPAHTGVYFVLKFGSGDTEGLDKVLSTFTAESMILYNDDYESAVSWANWSEEDLPCLNKDKLNEDCIQHLPLVKFESLDQLEKFQENYGDVFTMDQGYSEIPSFERVVTHMDEIYFEEHTVFLVYVSATSGTYRYEVNYVELLDNFLCIHIQQTNNPEVVTDDMAGWFLTVAIPKALVANCTEFDANLIHK